MRAWSDLQTNTASVSRYRRVRPEGLNMLSSGLERSQLLRCGLRSTKPRFSQIWNGAAVGSGLPDRHFSRCENVVARDELPDFPKDFRPSASFLDLIADQALDVLL